MPKIISIPTPCHEDWNAMTPDDKGRHCALCSKTVVDFTQWHLQEILFYLQQNSANRVCGRFAADQLDEPIPTPEDFVYQLSRFTLPFLKKAAAIFLFAFSVMAVSCNDRNPAAPLNIEIAKIDSPPPRLTGDTIIIVPLQGEPALIQNPPVKKPAKSCTQDPGVLKGDVAIVEQPTMGIVAPQEIPVDTIKPKQHLMGKPAMRTPPVVDNSPPVMTGTIAILPVKHVKKKETGH